jgi:hypothetical protein
MSTPIRGMVCVGCCAAASGIPRPPRVSRTMSPTVVCHMLISSRWLPASRALERVGNQTAVSRLREGRDRSAARATVGGEFPALALSIREVGASFHHGPRFRRPPCDPGRWAFPSPVLTLASRRSPSHTVRGLSADSHPPLHAMVCFHRCSIVPRPSMSGYAWSCQVPRAPLHVRGITSPVMVSGTMSVGITPPSSLVWAQASVLNPPTASVVPSDNGSVPVAVSPCWEEDLPF